MELLIFLTEKHDGRKKENHVQIEAFRDTGWIKKKYQVQQLHWNQ